MSQLDQVTVLCEGAEQSVDVRVLEAARNACQRDGSERARLVTIRPAGGKVEFPSALRAHRDVTGRPVFALRDRDYLRKELREEICTDACDPAKAKAYPTRRHCIESYLLEPHFVDGAGLRDITAMLTKFAEQRRWQDAAQAVLEAVGYATHQVRSALPPGDISNRESAQTAIRAALSAYRGEVEKPLATDIEEQLDSFSHDFDADGPLWHRVHGKKLFAAVEHHLREAGDLPGGGLMPLLVNRVENDLPPAALVTELRDFFEALPLD